jgi:hypothetical protein
VSGWHGHAWHGPGPHPWDSRSDPDPGDRLGVAGRSRHSSVLPDPDATAAELEAYLDQLRAEALGIDERLHAVGHTHEVRDGASPATSPKATAASLEAYLDELRAEAHMVDDRIHALRAAEAGHWPRRPDGHPARTSGRAARTSCDPQGRC